MPAIPPSPAAKLLPLIVYGVTVPCRKVRVKGAMRVHEHVYPHSPGAGIEILGRDLYKIEITPIFDANLLPPKYKGLWPAGLKRIREEMEKGTRKDISIPTVGVIPAVAVNWDQEFDASKCLSGEEVSWNFIEDSENLRLSSQSLKIGASLSTANDVLKAELAKLPLKKTSLWDTLMQAVDFVLSIRDQFELYSKLLESKLLSILQMLKQLDEMADELKDPSSWPLVEALHNVWSAASEFYQDQKQLGIITKRYTTKIEMSCMQLSTVLFGDATRSSELLQLNGFDDPFAIPANTTVKYYQIEEVAA
jgi:hypothetical protein